MPPCTVNYTRLSVLLATSCLLAGCWQEIEYRGPDPSDVTHRKPPVASVESEIAQHATTKTNAPDETSEDTTAAGEDFAEELADSLDEEPLPPDSNVSAEPTLPETIESEPTTPAIALSEPVESTEPEPTEAAANPISATVESPISPTDSVNTRLAAWRLGSNLSKAALAHDLGVATENIEGWFQEARVAADSLDTSLTDLPAKTDTADASLSRGTLNYLFLQGQQVGRDLAGQYPVDHAALFEVAVKSNLLLVLYKPGSSAANAISTAIDGAAPRANLPPELWQPLLDSISNQAPPARVQAAVRQLHADVDKHLAAPAEPKSR